MKAFKTVTGRF